MTLLLPTWLSGDGLKTAVFFAFVVALFVAARWAASRSETSANPPEITPELEQPRFRHVEAPFSEPQYLQPPSSARVDVPMHPEMQYGDILIRGLNFRTFDAIPGPPDPTSFCDEIMLELENFATGHRFMMSQVVATPEGLRKALSERRWEIMYMPAVYVVTHYDLKLIRDTIMRVLTEGEESLEELRPSADQGSDPVFGINSK